ETVAMVRREKASPPRRRSAEEESRPCPCGLRAAHVRRATRNRKRKGGSGSVIRLRPQATIVPLDDRAADEQPDSHAPTLRGVESIEQRFHAVFWEADAGIAKGHTHTVAVFPFGLDQQVSRAIVDVDHGVRAVAKQIRDDLLELNAVAGNGGEI